MTIHQPQLIITGATLPGGRIQLAATTSIDAAQLHHHCTHTQNYAGKPIRHNEHFVLDARFRHVNIVEADSLIDALDILAARWRIDADDAPQRSL